MSEFEWNQDKREHNLEKHGVDFVDAIFVFDDVNRIEAEIERVGEKRYIAIGVVNEIELLVVYTLRGVKKRIISARRASRSERKTYKQAKDPK